MRLIIAAVGRVPSAPEQELCSLYCERARAVGVKLGFTKLDLFVTDVARASTAAKRLAEEASRLTAKLPPATHRIALDEAGRSIASEAFARHLAKLRDSGVRDLAFLIGGPDGLASALKESANERLALGPQTWPHLYVRAMLAEQIYRAFAILSGHPYHRGRAH
jgi:23S rRNA (pseudouridine1915-N3)-methyltransferase